MLTIPRFLVVPLLLVSSLLPALAALRLPAIISDHLVLQGGQPVAIWGWADPGAKVTVNFIDVAGGGTSGPAVEGTAGSDGRWSVQLPALKVGSAGSLKIVTDKKEEKTVSDILVGQVWLASGQSNMDYRVHSQNTPPDLMDLAKQEAQEAKGTLRYFETVRVPATEVMDDVKGEWVVAMPETVGSCSAVAWYFGVGLREKLHQPVGLIVSAVGATPAESWLAKADLDALSIGPAIEKRQADRVAAWPEVKATYDAALAEWQKVNPTAEKQKANAATKPMFPMQAPDGPMTPTLYFNGMIHGLEPYTITGIIWYQGDGNAGFYQEYPELIQALIKTWRRDWGAELPFYYVEMNNMWDLQRKPVEDSKNLGPIREAQEAALQLPKTDVVAAIDLGDSGAITNPHFWNKKPVGQRLANEALEQVYGLQLGEVHSPEFKSFTVEGDKIRLKFDHADGLRTHGNEAAKGFAIRSATGDWIWADGKVDGNDMLVWSPQVPQPVAVRYAWAANPVISVENGVGLPLRPFRTDKNDAP